MNRRKFLTATLLAPLVPAAIAAIPSDAELHYDIMATVGSDNSVRLDMTASKGGNNITANATGASVGDVCDRLTKLVETTPGGADWAWAINDWASKALDGQEIQAAYSDGDGDDSYNPYPDYVCDFSRWYAR